MFYVTKSLLKGKGKIELPWSVLFLDHKAFIQHLFTSASDIADVKCQFLHDCDLFSRSFSLLAEAKAAEKNQGCMQEIYHSVYT